MNLFDPMADAYNYSGSPTRQFQPPAKKKKVAGQQQEPDDQEQAPQQQQQQGGMPFNLGPDMLPNITSFSGAIPGMQLPAGGTPAQQSIGLAPSGAQPIGVPPAPFGKGLEGVGPLPSIERMNEQFATRPASAGDLMPYVFDTGRQYARMSANPNRHPDNMAPSITTLANPYQVNTQNFLRGREAAANTFDSTLRNYVEGQRNETLLQIEKEKAATEDKKQQRLEGQTTSSEVDRVRSAIREDFLKSDATFAKLDPAMQDNLITEKAKLFFKNQPNHLKLLEGIPGAGAAPGADKPPPAPVYDKAEQARQILAAALKPGATGAPGTDIMDPNAWREAMAGPGASGQISPNDMQLMSGAVFNRTGGGQKAAESLALDLLRRTVSPLVGDAQRNAFQNGMQVGNIGIKPTQNRLGVNGFNVGAPGQQIWVPSHKITMGLFGPGGLFTGSEADKENARGTEQQAAALEQLLKQMYASAPGGR